MFRSDRFAALRGLAVLLAAVLLFALLATACGDDGGDAGETPQAGETPTEGETPATDGDGDGETGDGDGADGEALQELEALAAEATEGITAKVTYRVVTETDGETMEGEWVLVQRPPDSRFEIAGEEGGEEFRTIIISAGGNSYLCTSVAGEESCLATEAEEAEASAAALDPLFSVPEELTAGGEDIDITDTSHRSIAGVDATCFTISGALADVGEGEGEVCFSDEGLLLYMRGQSAGSSVLFEATSASTDVTDADFEPPYDILELPDLQQ